VRIVCSDSGVDRSEHAIKIFDVGILIMIKSRKHKKIQHQDSNLSVVILEVRILFDQLWSHHQLVYRSILEL
jgi:hypothetical protein